MAKTPAQVPAEVERARRGSGAPGANCSSLPCSRAAAPSISYMVSCNVPSPRHPMPSADHPAGIQTQMLIRVDEYELNDTWSPWILSPRNNACWPRLTWIVDKSGCRSTKMRAQAQVRNFQTFLLPGYKSTYVRTSIYVNCIDLYLLAINSLGCKLGRPSSTCGSSADSSTEPPHTGPASQSQVTQAHKAAPLRVKLCTRPAGLNSQLSDDI